jgi:hypothetical protein
MTMMTLVRFKALVAAYGGDPARWPECERIAALDLLERSAEARREMEEALEVDRLLDLSPSTPVTPALQERILASFKERPRAPLLAANFLAVLLPGRPAWVPAAALALSLALGVGVGAYAPALAGLDSDGARDAASYAMSGAADVDDLWDQAGEGI